MVVYHKGSVFSIGGFHGSWILICRRSPGLSQNSVLSPLLSNIPSDTRRRSCTCLHKLFEHHKSRCRLPRVFIFWQDTLYHIFQYGQSMLLLWFTTLCYVLLCFWKNLSNSSRVAFNPAHCHFLYQSCWDVFFLNPSSLSTAVCEIFIFHFILLF